MVTWIFFLITNFYEDCQTYLHIVGQIDFQFVVLCFHFFPLSFFFILSFDYTRQWFLNSDINEIAQCDFQTIFLISKSLISGFIHITSFFMLSFDLLCYLF